jgi:hypothetical protein
MDGFASFLKSLQQVTNADAGNDTRDDSRNRHEKKVHSVTVEPPSLARPAPLRDLFKSLGG